MPAPQLSSFESFHISKVKPAHYRSLFLTDNDGVVHLTTPSILQGKWEGSKIMEALDVNPSDYYRQVASYNKSTILRIEEFRRGN